MLAGMTDGLIEWWTVTDTGAALIPGDGFGRSTSTVRNVARPNDLAVVALGDLNDTLKTTAPLVEGVVPRASRSWRTAVTATTS